MFDNNKEKTFEEVATERFSMLPDIIKNAITESDWQDKIRLLSKKYSLRIDQSIVLENQTFLVMLALVSPDKFYQNLRREGELDENTAYQIAEEVNQQIIKDIKIHIVDFIDKEDTATKEEGGEEETESREDILNSIETVDEEKPKSIPAPKATEKLSDTTSTKSQDFSLDPYREELE